MIILVICLIVSIISYIIGRCIDSDEIEISCVFLFICSTFIFLLLSVMAISVHSPYLKQKELSKYEITYKVIMNSINDDEIATSILAEDIIEYNNSIIEGRIAMDNEVISFYNYDFYYDLPLIEVEKEEN